MKVDSLMTTRGNPSYYSAGFRLAVETHLPLIRQHVRERAALTERQLKMYSGDFYGLLAELGVSEEYHWPTLRGNGLHSPADFATQFQYIELYTPSVFMDILDQQLTTQAQL